jgi:hypothetical protein
MSNIVHSLFDIHKPSVRLQGISSSDFKVATWRGQDLLVQLKNGDVLILKGANAKRLAVPDFFLVFDDASLPLASFAPGLSQPAAGKAPHVPPFEMAPPVKVGRLPGGKSAKTATHLDSTNAANSWALTILGDAFNKSTQVICA